MKEKDFIKLRCKIHQEFKRWFSYSRKYNCLYCDWKPDGNDLNDLYNFVGPLGFAIVFTPPCSVFIYFDKFGVNVDL